ncbi:DUF6261 family protein [Mangrovibacterium lignilyticum]|uniref:DUF6261 family protein n=1 Tax=Mangrovibacterium lignilyticum TaxID=2668052 RepID=UPI0013CF8D91|nr:DUF6261 family protein [Mangrovibacterium lignilyticum]
MKNGLNFNYFNGAAFYAFVRALLNIVDSTKLSDGVLHSLAVKLETIYQSFSKGVEYDPKDPLTPVAAAADDKRDQYFNGMKSYISSFLKSPDGSIRAAAEKLEALIRKYGWSAQTYSYDEETTAIAKCIEEMNAYYAAEVALLNLPVMWLTPLTEAQAGFEAIQEQRIQKGAIEVPTVSKYRTPLRLAIIKLVETLETFAEETGDVAMQTYVAEIDELIGETMATLKASKTREENTEVAGL